jgi:hypothetical protein
MSRRVGEGSRAERFEAAHRRGLLRAMGTVVIALPLFVFAVVQGVFNLRDALFPALDLECPAFQAPAHTVIRGTLRPFEDDLPACHRPPHCFLARSAE